MLFPRPWMYGMIMCPLLGLPLGEVVSWPLLLEVLMPCVVLPTWVLLMPFPSWFPLITLFCTLLMAHLGYLHLTKASLRWGKASSRSSSLVQTVLALWVSVPMTLYLAERLWWLSHCKYWSVCVGLWYTFILRKLSASSLNKVSRKGIAPFTSLPSTWILLLDLYCWYDPKRVAYWPVVEWPKCHPQTCTKAGVIRGRPKGFPLRMLHIQVSYYRVSWWSHSCSFNLFMEPILKREVCIMQTEP